MCAATTKIVVSKAEQRQRTRAALLDAVLDIIVSDGMRAVRQRAVALRAGVALGTTTYHFKRVEDLIISAFEYWRTNTQVAHNPYYRQIAELLQQNTGITDTRGKTTIVSSIYRLSVDYIIDQLTTRKQDRIIELAFYHEALSYPALQQLVQENWQSELELLAHVHSSLGSIQPENDARISFALFRQLEQDAIIADRPKLDTQKIHNTLHRHFALCFNIDLPMEPPRHDQNRQ